MAGLILLTIVLLIGIAMTVVATIDISRSRVLDWEDRFMCIGFQVALALVMIVVIFAMHS